MIAVAAPGVIIVALFALLFMLCWQQWGTTIVTTLSVNVPIIGGALANAVNDAIYGGYAILIGWLDALINPIVEALLRPIAAVENTIGEIQNLGANTYNALWGIVNARIPAAIAAAAAYTVAFGNDVLHDAEGFYNQAVAYATAVGQEVLADAQSLYNQAVTYAAAVGQEVLADARSLYNQAVGLIDAAKVDVETYALTLYNQAVAFTREAYGDATGYATALAVTGENNLVHAVTQLEGYADATAQAAIGVLVTDTDNAIAGALSGIWTDVDNAVSDLVGVIGADDPDILAAVRALPQVLPADIAGLAALAGVSTLALTRYLKDCGIPNCQNLSQFGKELQDLLALAGSASFLGFLVELVEHPTDAYDLVESTFGAGIRDTVSTFRSLVGV